VTVVLFLDIDGVLAHFGSNDRLDPACLARLDTLVTASGATLVLTSSWRDSYGLDGTAACLAAAGLRATLARAVPRLPLGTRSDEIRAYLGDYVGARFVILDDVPPDRALRDFAVITDDFVGLTDADVQRARNLLKG
jgi:hypothetical protein